MKFLIYEGWTDWLENHKDAGWKLVGYVDSEDDAKKIVANAGFFNGDETHSFIGMKKDEQGRFPRKKYRAAKPLEGS